LPQPKNNIRINEYLRDPLPCRTPFFDNGLLRAALQRFLALFGGFRRFLAAFGGFYRLKRVCRTTSKNM
jgi:hypothetical protein